MSPHGLAWKPTVDRRARRSPNASIAARHYLERVLERCALDAISLASLGSGAIAAFAKQPSSRADLASLARAGKGVLSGDADAGIDGIDVFAHRVMIGREACVLVSAGSRVDRVKSVAADLTRIFA